MTATTERDVTDLGLVPDEHCEPEPFVPPDQRWRLARARDGSGDPFRPGESRLDRARRQLAARKDEGDG